jgi:hypothetical protein
MGVRYVIRGAILTLPSWRIGCRSGSPSRRPSNTRFAGALSAGFRHLFDRQKSRAAILPPILASEIPIVGRTSLSALDQLG